MSRVSLMLVSHTYKPFRLNDVMLNVIRLIVVAPKKLTSLWFFNQIFLCYLTQQLKYFLDKQGPYSQHVIFFVTYEWAQKSLGIAFR